MSRSPHKPTDEYRKLAEQLSSVGLPHDMIGTLIGDGINHETLRKYYAEELKRGKAKACAKIGNALFKKCMDGDTASILFWCKTQMNFKETSVQEIATVAQVKDSGKLTGTIEILKSYAIPDCSTEGIAQAIRADFPRRRINSIIDVSGNQINRDTTSPFGVTDRIILEKYGFTIVNSRKVNPLISDTDNTSNAFIARGGLKVKPDDVFLLEALSTYHYEDASRKKLVKYTEQKYAHIDGLGDCIRYGIHHLFPITHDSVGNFGEYVGMDPVYSRMNTPGLKYAPESPLYPGGPTMEEIINGDQVDESYMSWN